MNLSHQNILVNVFSFPSQSNKDNNLNWVTVLLYKLASPKALHNLNALVLLLHRRSKFYFKNWMYSWSFNVFWVD